MSDSVTGLGDRAGDQPSFALVHPGVMPQAETKEVSCPSSGRYSW
jgi:hypothetical protein